MSTTAAGAAREGTGVMDDEVTRLRALCEGIALPLSSAQTDSTAIELSDAEGVYIGSVDIDDGPLFDASEATEATAALIVAAVNALPALLDRVEAAERERDSLRAQLDTVAAAYRALLAGQPVPEYSGPVLSEQGRATLDRLRPRRDTAATERAERAEARVAELEARVAELEARGLALAEDARAAYAQRREMGSEAQRLREIIAGRTTPPTDAEILAHDADGGVWLLTWEHDGKLCADATRTLAQVRAYAASRPGEYAYRWRAIGRDGRPCAWPVVTEVSRG